MQASDLAAGKPLHAVGSLVVGTDRCGGCRSFHCVPTLTRCGHSRSHSHHGLI